jgi:5-formyltetrahydrofolate cyclo-ligase
VTDPSEAPAVVKEELRDLFLSRRRARPAAERAAAADAVTSALLQGLHGVRTLAAFVPDPDEPGNGRLPAAYTGLGARVLLPVVLPTGRTLDWAAYTGELEVGRFGLHQPVGPRLGPAAIGDAEAVVVPALAVDRFGFRLGRGGGYYDRALVHARPDAVLVTVVFDEERLAELPREVHDRPVTAVVTPSHGWEELAPSA